MVESCGWIESEQRGPCDRFVEYCSGRDTGDEHPRWLGIVELGCVHGRHLRWWNGAGSESALV